MQAEHPWPSASLPLDRRFSFLSAASYRSSGRRQNWSSLEVNLKGHYLAKEKWRTKDRRKILSSLGIQKDYNVGGNTKFFGAALFRLREVDFGEIQHAGGVSPAWPISYKDLESYYAEAEDLFEVRGERGVDPTEPPATGPYPYPAISHEERLERLSADFSSLGLHPFHTPLGSAPLMSSIGARAAASRAATHVMDTPASSTQNPTRR